jgi:hypothetical protein
MRDQHRSNISRAPFLEFITGKRFGQCPFAGTRAISNRFLKAIAKDRRKRLSGILAVPHKCSVGPGIDTDPDNLSFLHRNRSPSEQAEPVPRWEMKDSCPSAYVSVYRPKSMIVASRQMEKALVRRLNADRSYVSVIAPAPGRNRPRAKLTSSHGERDLRPGNSFRNARRSRDRPSPAKAKRLPICIARQAFHIF